MPLLGIAGNIKLPKLSAISNPGLAGGGLSEGNLGSQVDDPTQFVPSGS